MATEILSPTQFPLEEGDPLAPAHRLINAYLLHFPTDAFAFGPIGYLDGKKMSEWCAEAASEILALPVAVQFNCVRACSRFSRWSRFEWGWSLYKPETKIQNAYEFTLDNLCYEVLGFNRDWNEEEIQEMIGIDVPYGFQKSDVLTPVVEQYLDHHPITSSLRASIEQVREWNGRLYRLEHWLKLGAAVGENFVLQRGEKWADDAIAFIEGQPESDRKQWSAFLLHCIQSEKAKPTPRWLQRARTFMDTIGESVLETLFCAWCADYSHTDSPREINQAVFKGLVWSASLLSGAHVASAVGKIASALSHPSGSYDVKVSLQLFNACVWSLGEMREPTAHDQLLALKTQTRGSRLKTVEKALDVISARG